jgi:hypothetical protein
MGLETGTYISDLVSTNPTSSDPKSQGDDHLRLVKATIKATFPSITGIVTKTHTELNTVTDRGLIAGQTWTGSHTFPATTYGVTATLGDSSTKFATTAFVAGTAFSFNLPAQTGNSGKFVTTNGTTASWAQVLPSYTGNALKVLRVNAGTTDTEWVNNGEVPLGALVAFDSSKSENLITNGAVNFLKTGVIADATTYPLVDSSAWFSSSLTTLDAGMVAYTSIDAGNGVWIAVAQGFARVSTDGVGFGTPIALTGFGATVHSISFANGIFVILDSVNSVCATTTNGTTFTYGTLPSAGQWAIPAYGNGIWLTVRSGTFAMTSTDGLSWTARTNSLSLSVASYYNQHTSIAFGAGLFVVISQLDGAGNFSTTADGITWVSRSQTVADTGLVNVIFDNSLFVVRAAQIATAGVIRTSTNGITFTNRTAALTSPNTVTPVYYHNSNYVTQDGTLTKFFTSSNATAWTSLTSQSLDVLNLFLPLVVLGTQALAMDNTGKLYRSDGAGYWGAINVGTASAKVVAANGRFMYNTSINNCSAAMTTDGVNWWKLHDQGILNNSSINYNAGLYIIAGGAAAFHTSADLSTWTARTGMPASGSNTVVVSNSITFSLGGSSTTTYAYSTDNINFTSAVFPTSGNWTDVVFGNSTYLAITLTAAAASSATGLVGSWAARTLPIIPVGCVFANGVFVISSSIGVFYKSSDGITWTLIPTSSFNQDASGTLVVGVFKLGNSVFGYRGSTSRMLAWSGGSTVTTRTISFNPTQRSNVASDSSKVVGLFSTTTQYNGVAATDKILNDVNLKTYNATVADQTNFYKRVS